MDDHFWPSIYPGIVAGLLVGLAARSVMAAILGAIGGLAGAVLFFFLVTWLGVPPGLPRLLGLLGVAALGAALLVAAGQRLMRPPARETS